MRIPGRPSTFTGSTRPASGVEARGFAPPRRGRGRQDLVTQPAVGRGSAAGGAADLGSIDRLEALVRGRQAEETQAAGIEDRPVEGTDGAVDLPGRRRAPAGRTEWRSGGCHGRQPAGGMAASGRTAGSSGIEEGYVGHRRGAVWRLTGVRAPLTVRPCFSGSPASSDSSSRGPATCMWVVVATPSFF